ncbi:uncharacterized protein LOC114350993 isoform X2 [Ostrinia furnacalis]|uniref:uncharacterized protein LOC114350993 isoform X1 n=1 Tax=Ostrinia furnacalis TaxID=93504 RepID=UPI00103DF3CC|nr:uncharacterized protein LOC114350993 isoform X1 [Ostrinia furnacalis]XP_028157820.1 uncharacterized protein LOC114350993 isoform X2 [Ostrinia furnacalis]
MSLLSKRSTRKTLRKSKSKSIEHEYSMQDLPSLRRKRTISIKRLNKALEVGQLATSDPSQRDLFFSYHQDIKQIAETFEYAHFNILELLDDTDDLDSCIQEQFDDTYYKIESIYRTLTRSEDAELQQSKSVSSSFNIRLPKITLPTFSGNIKQWPEYFDTFNALIHNSSSLTDTERFHYLVSSLSGDALSIVKAFPLTHEHYNDAYQALCGRYKNKRDLAFTCWREILNIEFKSKDAREFRKSLDIMDENLSILKTINLPVQNWNFVLVYHLLSKLDTTMRRSFEEKYCDIEFPTYDQLKLFLQSKCEALIRDTHFLEPSKSKPIQNSIKRPSVSHTLVAANDNRPATSSDNVKPIQKCSYCNDTHSISSCSEFRKKSIDERMKIAEEKKWCYNCLKSSHQIKNCNSFFTCRFCKRKHHTLLHRDKSDAPSVSSSLFTRSQSKPTVLLATAIVQVKDAHGDLQSFRALFDTGSQSNFITESAVKRLQLVPTQTSVSVSGLGDACAPINGDVTCCVGTNNKIVYTLNMHVISKICSDQPIAQLNTSRWSHIKSITLADPSFDIPGPIDILFAADVFAESLLGQQIKGSQNQPTAFNSIFGWLLLGKTFLNTSTALLTHTLSFGIDHELNSLVKRFWELDNVPKATSLTPEEQLCENKFVTEHERDTSGRYIVKYPFKDDSDPMFQGSREVALRRFHAIEKRLSRDNELYTQYREFMSDYIESNHMSLVPLDQMGRGKYYIPHHCVLRPDSTTTRLRVVFDASAKDLNARSFNDTQLIGPKLQPDIFKILLNFRQHQIVVMADVRQMYRQILVSPDHREYQRILWRPSPSDVLREYRLNTVTYGVASSPYLACRTLRQLADDEGDAYPLAKQIIKSHVYVDDVVCGFDSFDVAQEAKTQLIKLFNLGRFELRKWVSNEPQLLSDLPIELHLQGSVSLDQAEPSPLKVLGLKWDPSSDSFLFSVKPEIKPCTKRSILSELARIFDPLGFLSPITIQAKCLIQKLWILGVDWDETPPIEVVRSWTSYSDQLPNLTRLRIPRKLTCSNSKSYELHGFCDSSEIAYGAVIYLRTVDETGNVKVFFVCSKARVVPLKRIPLPRLELCAAVLLADLYKYVRDTYLSDIPINSVFLWSDATIVLSWLRSHSSRWTTFVANRVSHIQEIAPSECWHHVSSGDNPADICSRGLLPNEILNNSLWWAGPCWLSQEKESWPSHSLALSKQDEDLVQAESRKSVALVTGNVNESDNFNVLTDLTNRFSSLQKLLNVLSYVNRNQLASLMQDASQAEKIEFKFNPPSAPHFGGVWEIQIKAAKSHLYRVVGDQVLTFEELTTLFVQIEAILNSRPLCPVSADPSDLSALTPGHFLTLEPLTAVPDEDLSSININRLHRWQLLQSFHQNFWSRWKHEYLNSLTQRAKWTKDSKPLAVGSMVIIKDDNRAPLHWTLGRVQQLIAGADGIVRIAMVKTATNNLIQRPLVKLCPLPIEA